MRRSIKVVFDPHHECRRSPHNHGFLHAGHGQWRLAPAFDLNPLPDRVRELKTRISATTGPEASIDALLSAAPYFKLSRLRGNELLTQVEDAVAGWRDAGRSLGMTDAELEPFAPAFEHSERNAVRRASTSAHSPKAKS